MQEALTQVQQGIDAAEKEFKEASSQPLVVVLLESLIKEAPKAGCCPRQAQTEFTCILPIWRVQEGAC